MVNPVQYERAAHAWPLLTEKAASESKITYADLAQHLGIHARPIRYVLGSSRITACARSCRR
jgi:hypothetical protein